MSSILTPATLFGSLKFDVYLCVMKVYQVIEVIGCGVVESPAVDYPMTGEVYESKEKAEGRAKELWYSKTTEQDRKSGWCCHYFNVKEVEIK